MYKAVYHVWANSWIVNNSQAILDGDGNVTGYKATVATRNTKGELIDTGISIFSGATTDSDGNTTSTGVWMSKSYQTEAAKAEEKK